MQLFNVTIFLSAFLLFQIQPLIARYFLPWFGGAPSVWVTSMLVFQTLLLAGYCYAHGLVTFLQARRQVRIHTALISICLLILAAQWLLWNGPLFPSLSHREGTTEQPVLSLVFLLIISVGLPFLLLSTTSSLLQAWHARAFPNQSPYHLYAWSNAGSLLGLLTYPLVFEPFSGLRLQALIWSIGFVLLSGLLLWLAWRSTRLPAASSKPSPAPDEQEANTLTSERSPQPQSVHPVWWFVFSFTGVLLFLGTSNFLTMDIGGIAVLWILPLALYLATFIYTFSKGTYPRTAWLYLSLIGTVALCCLALRPSGEFHVALQVGIPLAAMTAACVLCHGDLYALRPGPEKLTVFYLWVSVGGAAAGIATAVVAPLVFQDISEFLLSFALCYLLLLFSPAYLAANSKAKSQADSPPSSPQLLAPRSLALVGLVSVLFLWVFNEVFRHPTVVDRNRNFFGVLMIKAVPPDQRPPIAEGQPIYMMTHGATTHGIGVKGRPDIITAYYSPEGGMGLALLNHPARAQSSPERPFRVGIVGLGVGTALAYTQGNDHYRAYEIDPAVVELAKPGSPYFSYLDHARGQLDIVIGDGRLELERELARDGSHQFDVLVLDAFSGDMTPCHLFTLESFRIYEQHLAKGGVIAIHISNRYYDFKPLVARQAQEMGWNLLMVKHRTNDRSKLVISSDWALLARPGVDLATLAPAYANLPQPRPLFAPWTDDWNNPVQLLKIQDSRPFLILAEPE